jgi:O-antigen/teichoic acid export membrane protein
MSEYKLFAQRIGLIGIVNIISTISGFILLPILTKTLSTELYGIWALIGVTGSLLVVLATLQLNNAITRFFAAEKDVNKIRVGFYSVFTLVFLINLLIIVIILFLSKPLAITFFGGEEALPFVRLLCFIIPSSALNAICIGYFRALQQVKKYAGFLILQPILNALLISYAVLSGYSLLGALVALIIVNTISLFLSFFFIHSQIGIGKPDLSVLKPYLAYSLPLIFSVTAIWIVEISDRYVIAYFLGIASVGIYSAAYNLGSMVRIFMGPIGTILLPTISNLYDNNKMEELKAHLKYSLKLYLMFAIPSLFGLTVLSRSLLLTLTTSEYVSAYLIVPIVALGTVFYVSTGICSIILAVVKKTKLFVWLGVMNSTINITLNVILIPIIGILGAAISTLITFVCCAIILIILSFREIPFGVDFNFISKSIISSIPMAFVVWKLNPYGAVNILISVGIATAVYFGILILLRGFTKEEYVFLKRILRT